MKPDTRKRERGQAMVEAAIAIPLLLVLMVGIFEVGRAYQTWQVVTNAAREGARMVIGPPAVGPLPGISFSTGCSMMNSNG